MVQTPQSLPARPTNLAIVGSYLGRSRFGAALVRTPSVHVTGIVDADTRSGRGFARELAAKPAVYSSVDRLMEANPDLDGVVVAYALPDRSAAIEALVSAGIPVLTEFPYTKTLIGMDRLNAIAVNSRTCIVPALAYRYDPAALALAAVLANGTAGTITRVRCEVNFPLSAAYALENGVVPVSIDWYDLLQVVAVRTLDLCEKWLGKPQSVNADIDLPHHAALAGRRAADPVANLIVIHEHGQSTHLLKLSRSVQPTERYLLYGDRGSVELVKCDGEKLAAGPTVQIHLTGSRPETIYASEDCTSEFTNATANLLADFAEMIRSGVQVADSTREARTALETVHAAFASARDGIRTPLPLMKPVDVDGILESAS